MAHEILGTFNKSQFDRFLYFARGQQQDIKARLSHLSAELFRVGSIAFAYDQNGVPTHYTPSPAESYIGRLLSVYEVLGGNAFFDMNLRSATQPVFLVKADEAHPAQLMSNGEIQSQPGQNDGNSAVLMQQLKAWLPDVMHTKRDYLERKIRRALDYTDQLQAEITLLSGIESDGDGGFETVVTQITDLIDDPSYRAISDDEGADLHGKLASAPFLPYSTGGPDAENADSYGRDTDGAVKPGEKEAEDEAP